MKNTILKSIFALVMAFIALPMMGQDYLKIYFKDGTFRKFYLKNVNEITVSKSDANGVGHSGYEYQRITCPQNDYVYSLQDVDSVTFTKYDEEKVKENFDTAMPEVFSLFSKCKDISDVESMLDSFKNVKGVEKVWTEGCKFYVKIPGWEPMPFHFETNDTSSAEDIARTLLPAFSSTMKKDGEKLKAAIANQRGFNFEKLAQYFRNCNIDVSYDSDKEPTLDFFLSGIYKYDLVFLFTHGAYLNGKHWLLTSHQLTDDLRWKNNVSEEMMNNLENILNREEYRDKQFTLGQDIDIHFSSGPLQNLYAYISISEDCIKEKSVGKFPNNNSILFNGACESLIYGNSLAEIYLGEERGLGVYFGYDDDNFGSKTAGSHFFTSLLEGKSVTKSYYDIPEKYRDESGMINPFAWIPKAKLLPVTHKSQEVCDNLFLFPTYTNIISQDEVNEQYKNRSYVQVEGITRTLNPDAVELGFVYGTGENLTVDKYITNVELNYLGPSNNIGNYLFIGKITDLEPGKTYSYRAYTYDGTNYNYGNLESFTIYEKLTLSTNAITLPALTCSSIEVSSGSGNYSVFENTAPDVVTASISGNIISLEAHKGGTATITVKDDKSGDTAPIEVTVEWNHLSFAIDGTVDLKVGESTTVDITSGSGSYSIEEIKPAGVVTASVSENSVIIEALKAGTATITVKDDKSGEKKSIEVKVQVKDIPAEAIDLGLPSGILWASYNVGATTPEEYGSYFAWGEIEDKDVYYWTTYSHCDGVSNSCHDIGADISGTRFDVAHMRWEGEWRMPTAEEFKELVYKCDYQVTTQNGVYGFKFTGPNGNSIFFPAAGYRFNTGINKAGSSGEYWSSTVRENKNYAYDTSMSADYVYWDCYINRFAGLPVRPVKQAAPALEDLVLSTTSPISLKAGETSAVQIISGNGVYSIFDNTAPNVVTASISENNVIIEALTPGTATITVKDDKSGEKESIEVTVTENTTPIAYLTCPDDHHPHMIDLGLPSGTKWACCNVGADKPEDNGGYYAWGETEEKDIFTWGNYTHCDGTSTSCHNLGGDISGTKYDIAYVKWGENWCMPSYPQLYELNENCSYKMTTINGIDGRIYTGKNGGSIFLPMPGYRWYDELNGEGLVGMYWSSTQYTKDYSFAVTLYFNTHDECYMRYDNIAAGISVRPVAK